jgi:hypothetical protein
VRGDVPGPQPIFWTYATTPPMGWNSWDCFGAAVTEDQAVANAQYVKEHLAVHGWQYIVVDIQWYEPNAKGDRYRKGAKLEMDQYGRLLPAINRFPSAGLDETFKPLADKVHEMGLKFGVHLLRGIPRQAVARNTPILGTEFHAGDIADKADVCAWNTDMYGVDMSKPGAQEYYDSVLALMASWGIDFIKVDDLSRPYHTAEIAAIRKAIDKTGREIVCSTSPGATPVDQGDDIAQHANMWRISDDFWDNWKALKEQFTRLDAWTPFRGAGHFPDADMLPLGNVRTWTAIDGGSGGSKKFDETNFTHDEQITLMSLWCIARSPLIVGANLPKNDDFTLSLLDNDEVLAVDQHSTNNRQIARDHDLIVWAADIPDSGDKYVALFNAKDDANGAQTVSMSLHDLGWAQASVRDLWAGKDMGNFSGTFSAQIPRHGAGLYRMTEIK